MKCVEIIHVNGVAFSVEKEACDALSTYVHALEVYFKNKPGGEEVISDIEARIGELFVGRPGGARAVVTPGDVAQVIAMLGTVEDIAGESDSGDAPGRAERPLKRLYRDVERRLVGGVCAGISRWTGIHVGVIRLLFVIAIFFWGFSCLVYLALYVITPPARKTVQKLEMLGKPVNVNTIAGSVNGSGAFTGRTRGGVGDLLVDVVRVGVGVFLCACGLFILVAVGCAVLFEDYIFMDLVEWDMFSFHELLQRMVSPGSYWTLLACAVFIIVLPVAACFFWGICLIASLKIHRASSHVLLLVTWVAAIALSVFTSIREGRGYLWRDVQKTSMPLAPGTLYLEALPSGVKMANNPLDVYYNRQEGSLHGKPNVVIHGCREGYPWLEIIKRARGKNRLEAGMHVEGIAYEVEVRDSLLLFPVFFDVVPSGQWKFQEVDVRLYVPKGTVIVIGENLRDRLLSDRGWFCREEYMYDGTLVMTERHGWFSLEKAPWEKSIPSDVYR